MYSAPSHMPSSHTDDPSNGLKAPPSAADQSVASLTADIEKIDITSQVQPIKPIKETAIFVQDACLQHRFIRSRDTSAIVERPERLRAVNIGLAAAMAHLEISDNATKGELNENTTSSAESAADDLVAALGRINLAAPVADPLETQSIPVSVVKSLATVDMFSHPAVKFIHGDIDGDVYLENLKTWARDSHDKILKGESEIPEGLAQGDLYLCPTSIDAIQGAIGTICEAVDIVVKDPIEQPCKRAFVSVRPPGHHCGEDTPSGFCFVNNVAVAAAHAHLQHGIQRVIIFDIDLHHGNGTQAITWQINEETYRKTLESEYDDVNDKSPEKPGLKVYYGSIHDILSYPCEDGKTDLVQAASVSLHGPHGQHIENIHLQPYESDEHFFDVLYKQHYSKIFQKAEDFVQGIGGIDDDVLVFISCGFDACEHEYPSMSRHGRKVPTSFYHRFAVDTCIFADKFARGRIISVLEGGYSDRALTSGAMAHLCGMTAMGSGTVDDRWWSLENLEKLEKATKKRRGGKQSLTAPGSTEPWIERAVAIFTSLDVGSAQYMMQAASLRSTVSVPSSMTLRERKKRSGLGGTAESTPASSPPKRTPAGAKAKGRKSQSPQKQPNFAAVLGIEETVAGANLAPAESGTNESHNANSEPEIAPRKLPRVILRMGPPPGPSPT